MTLLNDEKENYWLDHLSTIKVVLFFVNEFSFNKMGLMVIILNFDLAC